MYEVRTFNDIFSFDNKESAEAFMEEEGKTRYAALYNEKDVCLMWRSPTGLR